MPGRHLADVAAADEEDVGRRPAASAGASLSVGTRAFDSRMVGGSGHNETVPRGGPSCTGATKLLPTGGARGVKPRHARRSRRHPSHLLLGCVTTTVPRHVGRRFQPTGPVGPPPTLGASRDDKRRSKKRWPSSRPPRRRGRASRPSLVQHRGLPHLRSRRRLLAPPGARPRGRGPRPGTSSRGRRRRRRAGGDVRARPDFEARIGAPARRWRCSAVRLHRTAGARGRARGGGAELFTPRSATPSARPATSPAASPPGRVPARTIGRTRARGAPTPSRARRSWLPGWPAPAARPLPRHRSRRWCAPSWGRARCDRLKAAATSTAPDGSRRAPPRDAAPSGPALAELRLARAIRTRLGLLAPFSGRAALLGEVVLRGAMLSLAGVGAEGSIVVRLDSALDEAGADRATFEPQPGGGGHRYGRRRRARRRRRRAGRGSGPAPRRAEPRAQSSTAFQLLHSPEGPRRARARPQGALPRGPRFAILAPETPAARRLAEAFAARRERGRWPGRRAGDVRADRQQLQRAARSFEDAPFEAVFVPEEARRLELIAPALAAADLWSQPWGDRAPRRGPAPPGAPPRRNILVLSTAVGLGPSSSRTPAATCRGQSSRPASSPIRPIPGSAAS